METDIAAGTTPMKGEDAFDKLEERQDRMDHEIRDGLE
jgi:hypothetical protein